MTGNLNMRADDVQLFSLVVRTGNFSEAAHRLGVTRSAVSKAVTRLEKGLGVVLMRRSTRKLSLTDAGERFFQHAVQVDTALQDAEAAVAGDDQDVVGVLTVSMSSSFGAALLPQVIRKFRAEWPRLSLSLDFSDAYADLIGGGFDLAIRLAPRLEDSSLMSKRLTSTRQILVASPGYLKRFGTPQHPEKLKEHRCIDTGIGSRIQRTWRFFEGENVTEVPVSCSLTTTSDLPLILAACLDEGILRIPQLLVEGEIASGRLVEVLPEAADAREWGVFAVYPTRNPPAKVKEFIRFVEDELEILRCTDRWDPFGESAIQHPVRAHRVA